MVLKVKWEDFKNEVEALESKGKALFEEFTKQVLPF